MSKGRSIVNLKTNLRDLKYKEFSPGSAPYVHKDIGKGDAKGLLKEVTNRVDDIVRISKFIASGKGLTWESRQLALQGVQDILEGRRVPPQKSDKTLIGQALQQVGNSLLGALQLTTATLAQVTAGNEGYHHETFQDRAYLGTEDGSNKTLFGKILRTAGLTNDKSLVSGANIVKTGGIVYTGNPKYSLLGKLHVVENIDIDGDKDSILMVDSLGNPANSRAVGQRPEFRVLKKGGSEDFTEPQAIINVRSKYSPKGDSWYETVGQDTNYDPSQGVRGERYTRQQPYLAVSQQVGEEPPTTTVIDVLGEKDGIVEIDLGTKQDTVGTHANVKLPSHAQRVVRTKLEGPEKVMLDPGEVSTFTAHNGHSWENKQEFSSGSESPGNPGTYTEWISRNSGSQKPTYSTEALEQQLPGSVENATRGTVKTNGEAKDFHGNVIKYHDLTYPGVTDYTIGEENPAEEINPSDEVLKNFINHIPFQFCLITPETRRYMHFKANLENFSDDYTGNWDETQYVGRADRFYTYSGFGREISFAFKVAAFTQSNLVPMYRNLQTLAASVAPTYGEGGVFMRGTIGQVTIGDYLVRQYGIFKSVKLSWKTEYPWEIDKKQFRVPHILDVSVSFTPIHNFIPESLVDFTKEMYFGNKNKQGGL